MLPARRNSGANHAINGMDRRRVLLFCLRYRGPKKDGGRESEDPYFDMPGVDLAVRARFLPSPSLHGPVPGTVNSFIRTARNATREVAKSSPGFGVGQSLPPATIAGKIA